MDGSRFLQEIVWKIEFEEKTEIRRQNTKIEVRLSWIFNKKWWGANCADKP